MVDGGEKGKGAEQWRGLTVRARDGNVVGIVVGVFAEGPLAGRLRVHGDYTRARHKTGLWDGTAVYAIPRRAVRRREQDSLVLNATLDHARDRWLLYVVHKTVA